MEITGIGAVNDQGLFSGADSGILDKDDFLTLLVTQLRNQNPLEPMDASDYSAQLAQFTSVEQLTNISDTLDASLESNFLLASSINNTMAATVIGNDVRALGNQLQWNGEDGLTLDFNLAATATNVQIEIMDENGTVVRTVDAGALLAGDNEWAWDGTDNSGNALEEGIYTYSVEATGPEDLAIGVTTFMSGTITGVRYTGNGPVMLIGDLEIGLGDVYEIINR